MGYPSRTRKQGRFVEKLEEADMAKGQHGASTGKEIPFFAK